MDVSPIPGETAKRHSTPRVPGSETAEPHSTSPTPTGETAERPAHEPPAHRGSNGTGGTLVYDGDCGFCTTTARWVERRLNDGNRVVPAQQADLEALGLTAEDVARSAWWIDPDGTRRDEHLGIAGALRAMNGPWPALGRLLALGPISPLARLVYRLVARNRHRIHRPGTGSKCNPW